MTLKNWINKKISEIAKKLPQEAHENPASFACGYNVGYKQCLLDLDMFLQNDKEKDL